MPLELLHEAAVAAIRARPTDEPIAIACSGGADSVALLLLLWAHVSERRGHWLVLHFDHRLRGRASTGDANFVRALARRLGERCVVGTWQRTASAKAPRAKVSEAEARSARWAFFESAMRAAGARVIALGHQLNDVAETMLMRLARGSGTAGLAAPRPVQAMSRGATRVRPLLRLPAQTVRSLLKHANVAWREDATNATDDFLRNRVRRRVLPALIGATRANALSGFGDVRALLEEDDVALDTWLAELVPTPPARQESFDLSALAGKPAALVRRAIQKWANSAGLTAAPPKAAVDLLLWAVLENRDHRLSAGRQQFIVVHRRRLSLVWAGDRRFRAEPWFATQLTQDRDVTGPRGDRLSLRRARLTPRLFARIRAGDFPQDTMTYFDPGPGWPGWLVVRGWQQGDRYRPIGGTGRSKLQDLFVNRRVPREQRALLPVVLSHQGNVLWVPGLPVADEVAIQPAAKLVVQLTYTAAPPIVDRPKSLLP